MYVHLIDLILFRNPNYPHLPPHLAQQLAALPPLQSPNLRRRYPPISASSSSPPLPLPLTHPPFPSTSTSTSPSTYSHLPPHLAQQLAAWPPLPPHHRHRTLPPAPAPAPAPAPLVFHELAAQCAALPPVVIRSSVSIDLFLEYSSFVDF